MRKDAISKTFLAVALLVLMAACATAPKPRDAAVTNDAAEIAAIEFQDNGLTIASNKSFTYTVYTTDDPYRVTIEIPDMSLGKFRSKMVSEKTGITEIIPYQVDGQHPSARIDVILQTPSSVVPLYKDNVLTFRVKAEEPVLLTEAKDNTAEQKAMPSASVSGSKAETAMQHSGQTADAGNGKKESRENAEAASANPEKAASPPPARATEITGIELKKSTDALRVMIHGNGSMAPNVFPLKGKIVIDIPDVSMEASVPTSVVSPLKGIRAGKHRDKVRIVLDLKARTDFDVAAEGDVIEVALRKEGGAQTAAAEQPALAEESQGMKEKASLPETAASAEESEAKPVTLLPGERIAAGETEKETEIEGAMKTSDISVPGESKYRGKKISLDFQDAEIGPIFRLLADVNGYNLVLDPAVRGKITIKLMNVPWDQALDIILNTFNLGKSIEGNILWIAPNATFAKILEEKKKARDREEIAEPLVQEIVRVNYAAAGDLSAAVTQGKLLSPRGSITIDSRMNTLIIKDSKPSIERIKELVKVMDVAKPQVMIEAKLVQVASDYSQSLGIRWGGTFFTPAFPNTFGGSFSVNTPTIPAGPDTTNPGGTTNMTIGSANTFKVNVSLSALETIGKSKTLSNPKVLTMDGEPAMIQQGRTFFISTVSQAGTQTQQQQATLSLQVTPKITPDGYVQLKVTATDNSLEPGTSGDQAIVDTKSLTTQALVKNGETLVLGGIYTFDKTETEDGVPLLSKIPGLGWLFKTKNTLGPNVKELLIFITPNIVEQKI